MIVAFTGHRPDKLHDNILWPVFDSTVRLLEELRPEKTISGLADGYDLLGIVASHVLGIPCLGAMPWSEHHLSSGWRGRPQDYDSMLEMLDDLHIVTPTVNYQPWHFQKRNEWMVDNCDAVIACWNGTRGGTANCIKYARRKGRTIYNIHPDPAL